MKVCERPHPVNDAQTVETMQHWQFQSQACKAGKGAPNNLIIRRTRLDLYPYRSYKMALDFFTQKHSKGSKPIISDMNHFSDQKQAPCNEPWPKWIEVGLHTEEIGCLGDYKDHLASKIPHLNSSLFFYPKYKNSFPLIMHVVFPEKSQFILSLFIDRYRIWEFQSVKILPYIICKHMGSSNHSYFGRILNVFWALSSSSVLLSKNARWLGYTPKINQQRNYENACDTRKRWMWLTK